MIGLLITEEFSVLFLHCNMHYTLYMFNLLSIFAPHPVIASLMVYLTILSFQSFVKYIIIYMTITTRCSEINRHRTYNTIKNVKLIIIL